MKSVALCSAKASPGVTTTTLALAFVWPAEHPLVVIEADASGGDLIAMLNLAPDPNLVSLATAARREGEGDLIAQHTQQLEGLRIVAAPSSADQTRAALGVLDLTRIGELEPESTALVDCGRIDPNLASWQFVTASDLVVLCSRPVVNELQHAANAVSWLRSCGVQVVLLLTGDGDYGQQEIADALEIEVIGQLPHDPVTSSVLIGRSNRQKNIGRSPLLRSARSVAEAIAVRLQVSANAQEEMAS